jgi:hypothetical protein
MGLPVLRALSLCTCCRHYPGAADELQTSLKLARLYQPSPKWVSGRPAHRPFRGLLSVHSRCGLHTRTVTYVTVIRGLQTLRYLHACPGCFRLELLAGWDSHPLENAAFARRTPQADTRGLLRPSQLRPFVHVGISSPTALHGWRELGTKPSFGQSVVNVGFRMNWPSAGLPRSARQRASLHGSDFAGIGSHAKIVAAASLTKNPTSEVVAHFLNPTGYLAQWCKHGEPTPPRAPPFSRICSVLGRQTCVPRQAEVDQSRSLVRLTSTAACADSGHERPYRGGCPRRA